MVQHNYFQICFYSGKIFDCTNWKSDRFNYVCLFENGWIKNDSSRKSLL